VPAEPGDSNKKLPERADALKIDLPFEDALGAALATPPPKKKPKKSRDRSPPSS
jgi:hypothetical protein